MWAVVPIKRFDAAKQRLTDILSVSERIEFASAMLRDVLVALTDSTRVSRIVVVSHEPQAETIARSFAATFLPEGAEDLSLAVTQAGKYIFEHGANAMLMVPGDVPLLTAGEVDELIETHGERTGMTIVSDADGSGTNGIVVSPVDLIPFAFGVDSYRAHCAAADTAQAPVQTIALAGLSLDIDTPEDLRSLMMKNRSLVSADFLRRIDVVSRLGPRHNIPRAVLG